MDKELELAITNPKEYLSKPQSRHEWDMSIDAAERVSSYNPTEVLLTKAQRDPKGYGWVRTMLNNIGRGAESFFSPETGAQALTELYTSPHMPKEQAERLIEDMAYTRYAGRMTREAARPIEAKMGEEKYPITATFSQGVGQFLAQTLTGIANPYAAWSTLYATSQQQMEDALVDSYIEKTGGIQGYADRKYADDMLVAGYSAINTLIERGLGAERIIERAFHNPTNTGLKDLMSQILNPNRIAGKQLLKQTLKQAGQQALKTGLGEYSEEFFQEYLGAGAETLAGYKDFDDLLSDKQLQQALIAGAYAAPIGAAAGFGMHYANRTMVKKRVNEWAKKHGLNLTDSQLTLVANELMDETQAQAMDQVMTMAEIRNQYGQAFDTVKQRIKEIVEATGTTPWTDQNKTIDEYVQTVAETVTLPAIIQANRAGLPLSEFLDIANMQVVDTANGKAPILLFQPIESIDDLRALLNKQNAIIKEQTDAAKLGNETPGEKEKAQRRKAILQYQIRAWERANKAENARRTRRKEEADYITAKDLQPEQVSTLDNAVTAEPGQEYVLLAGKRIPVEYQVVELAEVQPSHINGEPNPNYTNTELQNRASRGTTQDVADLREKATNITPERLLRANTAAEGAPVVNARGEVIAGNGRAEIVRYAYENPETAQTYRTAIENAGFKTEGMQQPILVRRNTTLTDQEQVAAADISNISETSAFDEASQARRDTQYLKDSATPTDFAAKLPMSERRGLMQNNGRWNKRQVQHRYEDALLSWLCGNDTQLFEALVLDGKIPQKVLDVLTANGNMIYDTATRFPETSLREDIYHALQKMQMATKDNFLELTQQIPLDGRDVMAENILIWNWLYADTTTNRQFMSNYATTLATNHEQVANGQDMFGQKVAPISKKDALMRALKTTDEERAQAAATRGREYESLFTQETGEVKNPELAAAIASYENQFAPQADGQLFQRAYISGTTFYNRPSTAYVLVGGEGQIVHGWGIYSLRSQEINKARYRDRQFAGKYVFVPNMPQTSQLIKGAKNQKESQIFNTVLETIAGRTPINMHKEIGFASGISAYIPIFYLDALYEVMGEDVNRTDKAFLDKVIEKGQFADETVFKVDPKMSKWLQRAILQTLDMHNDLKNSAFYKKDLPYIFVDALTLNEVQQDFLDFIKKDFKHKDLSASANKALAQAIVEYVQNSGRIEYEPFDNAVFEKAGAKVLDSDGIDATSTIFDIIETLRDIYGKTVGIMTPGYIDRVVKEDPENYSGFAGLAALAKRSQNMYVTSVFDYSIPSGKTTLGNIDQDPDFQYMKDRVKDAQKKIMNPGDKFFVSIVESAQKIYKSKKFNEQNSELTDSEKTWLALSQAMRNLTKEQTDTLGLLLFTNYNVPEAKLNLFIQALQRPENIKQTRGQQLEIDIPENDVLLDEDTVLANQPSANLIRPILEDFLPGGLLYDFVRRANKKGFENFRKAHNLKEKDLDEFHENVFEQAQQLMFGDNPKMPESGALFIDYLMENLKGGDFYIALAESIQDTYIKLKSGEIIGEEKDYDSAPEKTVMGVKGMSSELVRDASLYLNDQGIKGITYRGGIDGRGFVIFSDEAVQTLRRMDDELPIYYQGRVKPNGFYDPELQAIVLSKNWNETTLVHEFHHKYLEKIWGIYRQAMDGTKQVTPEWLEDTRRLFEMLEIDPNQESITVPQQERFASMVEAYITGLGTENTENIAFQQFMHWVPEKYLSIMNIGYLDENNVVQNPFLDEQSIAFFNRWFGSPIAPSLPSAPDAQRMVNATDNNGQILPANQKTMNNREKDWGQDSEEQNKADAQLWRAIGENTPSDMRAALDGEEEIMKAEGKALPNDRLLPTPPKQTLRERWLKTRQPNARETAAEAARKYVAENPDHARELAFADPETMVEYDAPVDHGMLIRAVMETVGKGSDEWYILDNNLAIIKSMSGSTLALSGDLSHQAYLDAKREIESARELKAAVNYAGTREGAMEKWNQDIREFIAKRAGAIIATTPDSAERELAIKAFIEEAKTKFSGNTTNAILNQLDLTGYKTTDSRAFIKWAEKQIKQAAHAHIDTKEQAELMKASIAAQVALQGINSTETKDGKYVRAVQSAKDIRHWQFVKNKMKKAYIGRWGKFGIFMDNLFGSYAPSAMLMSVNTLFFANVPSTAINAGIISQTVKLIGDNKVDETLQKNERERIRQVFNASGINLAQMEKPTSPSMLHGEKYTTEEQAHWYNFTFNILGREDNWFRIPRFVDALARIATKNAKGDKAKADALFQEYTKLDNKNEEAQLARKQALAVANMAVFTQDGMMASALNHIRSQLNTLSRGILGLEPGGFGLGNILAPFLKTGANIIEMGLTASLAPVRTLATGLKVLQGKEIPGIKKMALATDWVYFTFTAVAVAILAAISGDDDKWYEEPYQPGKKYDPNKPYDSIRIGDIWIKLDIFGPLEIPLRTAAKMVQDWEKKKTGAIASGLAFGALEALGEMPLANQITDSPIEYITKYPDRWAQGFLYNQANKLVPAQIKTVSRAASRATGTTVSTEWAGKTIDRKFHRNYGLDGERLTTNDLINILTNRLKYNPQ